MTHICVIEISIIGSDNGLSPWPPSHYLNQCWNIVNWTLRKKLQWNFNRNSNIFIEENMFENVVCEMSTIFSRPRCVKLCQKRFPSLSMQYQEAPIIAWLDEIIGMCFMQRSIFTRCNHICICHIGKLLCKPVSCLESYAINLHGFCIFDHTVFLNVTQSKMNTKSTVTTKVKHWICFHFTRDILLSY